MIGWIIVAMLVAAFGFYVFVSEGHLDREEPWDIVPVGAQCATLGAEERTYGGDAVFCAAFPRYGLQVWSRKETAVPAPAPADPREAQVLVCMRQSGLDRQNCTTGIEQYELASR
ncbi:hypothetical protein [Mycolicibacterium sp. P9-22]|uniref:hypothetical protein n=1 Tax=Mycolicibacterium sp. P9-22 TaxID=2024613 RepID=UPI00188476F0|nr:hypothetical protein [Mycolicibacterium sp. P9-22]